MKFFRIKPNKTINPSSTKAYKINSIKELMRISLPYKNKIMFACLCVFIVTASQLLKPYILKLVIDDFFMSSAIAQNSIYSITSMGLLYLITSVTGSLFSYAQSNLVNQAGQEIIKNLRKAVFRTIQFLPLSYLDQTSSGRLITRATNDIAEVSDFYTDALINLIKDAALLAGIIYAMLTLNTELALVSFSVIPVMTLLVVVIKRKIRENFFNTKHFIGKINGFMAESIIGMKIIQIFKAEQEKSAEFSILNNQYFKTTQIQVMLNSLLRPASDIFQNLATAILLWYCIGKLSNHSLQIGTLYAFTTYIKQFFVPISDIADKYNNIQSALVSTERIFELLQQKNTLENLGEGVTKERIEGSIEFKNVWFAYTNNDWVLKNISFKINNGETVAFVGETGAGKSTITNLINGFYKVQKGEILIDGENINNIQLADLRRNIAVVLQDVFLFSGNIKDNIALNDQIDDHTLENALKVSCADTFVHSFANGIYEPVMERGNTLSAGQRQLISFARAIAHNASIFVLDEATANIDTYTEKLIQKAIEHITKNKTTLIIAHRLSTIKNADKIIVMKNGKVVEIGNHIELVNKGGYYNHLLTESKSEFRDVPLRHSTC